MLNIVDSNEQNYLISKQDNIKILYKLVVYKNSFAFLCRIKKTILIIVLLLYNELNINKKQFKIHLLNPSK